MPKILIVKAGERVYLDPLCTGFAHGFGIFETMRVAAGRLEFWDAHFDRFFNSAKKFDLASDFAEESGSMKAMLLSSIRSWARAEDLRLRMVKVSLLAEGDSSACYVYSRPMICPDKPVCLRLDTTAVINPHSVLAGHKTHNYMEAMYLLKAARSAGFFDIVRVNTSGFLVETTVSNLFFIRGDPFSGDAASQPI